MPDDAHVLVELSTSLGRLVIDVNVGAAPISGNHFLRHVDEGLYDGSCFYRTVRREHWTAGREMELIQGGVALEPDRALASIAHESPSHTGLRHVQGAVSLARAAPGTASAEFFICLIPCPGLDPTSDPVPPADGLGYAVFGHLASGMDVARSIQAQATADAAPMLLMRGQLFVRPVKIERARRIEAP